MVSNGTICQFAFWMSETHSASHAWNLRTKTSGLWKIQFAQFQFLTEKINLSISCPQKHVRLGLGIMNIMTLIITNWNKLNQTYFSLPRPILHNLHKYFNLHVCPSSVVVRRCRPSSSRHVPSRPVTSRPDFRVSCSTGTSLVNRYFFNQFWWRIYCIVVRGNLIGFTVHRTNKVFRKMYDIKKILFFFIPFHQYYFF